MGGYIMQLQNYSVNDGDGIRTVVFLAGCPLHCAWCANPEGQTLQNSMTHWTETGEILSQLHRQEPFYRASGGGITFSGGEATAQPAFLAELTDALYDEGYSLAIETCGQFDFARIEPVLRKMDHIFMDLKLMDPKRHQQFTGVDNARILENLARTAKLGIPMTVRIPTILGVNGNDEDMAAAFDFLVRQCPGVTLELLPYHRYGEGKYRQLGLTPPGAEFDIPSKAQMAHWQQMARAAGLTVVSYR